MKKLKIGVIGCGRIAKLYIDTFKSLSDRVEVKIAIDKVKEKADAFAEQFAGCQSSTDLNDLLKMELDVVHVLTPHHLHKEHTIASLKSNKHVLTEKPIAINLTDADEMAQCAKDNNLKLSVIFQNRYIKGIEVLKQMVESGQFGELKGVWSALNWHRPPSYYEQDWKGYWDKEGGGVVIDQAIHSLDLVRYIVNADVKNVQGRIANRVLKSIEVEDIAEARITFENDVVYNFYANNYFIDNVPIMIEFVGTKGMATLRGEDVYFNLKGEEPYLIRPEALDLDSESYWGQHHLHQIKDFYDHVTDDKELLVTPEDATKTLELVLKIYQSAQNND